MIGRTFDGDMWVGRGVVWNLITTHQKTRFSKKKIQKVARKKKKKKSAGKKKFAPTFFFFVVVVVVSPLFSTVPCPSLMMIWGWTRILLG
jgi:uncharacterized membrane protein